MLLKYRKELPIRHVNDIVLISNDQGDKYFTENEMRYFRTRLYDTIYAGRYSFDDDGQTFDVDAHYFITSELFDNERYYTVRVGYWYNNDYMIENASTFGEFGYLDRARREAMSYAIIDA